MARVVGIGHQDFETVIQKNCFYIDKTGFIKEWWENNDAVTLITRPRRFGKTLNMSMVHQFFSVDYAGRYVLTSNRESGFGRYDIMLEPKDPGKTDNSIIIEFKVNNPKREKSLEETAEAALTQIEEKKYDEVLKARKIPKERIKKYGFAFRGKEVLIRK